MAIQVQRKTIVRRTVDQLRAMLPHMFQQREETTVYGVPADIPITIVGVTTDDPLSDAQKDQLESAIKQIAGVNASLVLIDTISPSVDEVPAGFRSAFKVSCGFINEPDPS